MGEVVVVNEKFGIRLTDIVSEYGRNFIRGVQEKGVFACAKHFPGHGNTDTDSHSSLPTINVNKETLYKNEIYYVSYYISYMFKYHII